MSNSTDDPLCVCGLELSLHPSEPLHNFVDAAEYYNHIGEGEDG